MGEVKIEVVIIGMAGGGGATHVAFETGTLSSLEQKKDQILIVAGGGGGSTGSNGYYCGGDGGGTTGGVAVHRSSWWWNTPAGGGTQDAGGKAYNDWQGDTGTFGQGGGSDWGCRRRRRLVWRCWSKVFQGQFGQ